MGLNFSFFKTPKHRVFTYQPLYFDEQKERLEELKNDARREKAEKEGLRWKNERYIPGKNIRGSIRGANQRNRRHAMNPTTRKVVGVLSIILVIAIMFYAADYFRLLIESIIG